MKRRQMVAILAMIMIVTGCSGCGVSDSQSSGASYSGDSSGEKDSSKDEDKTEDAKEKNPAEDEYDGKVSEVSKKDGEVREGNTVCLEDIQKYMDGESHGDILAIKDKDSDSFRILDTIKEDIPGMSADDYNLSTGFWSFAYPLECLVKWNPDKEDIVLFSDKNTSISLNFYETLDSSGGITYIAPFAILEPYEGGITSIAYDLSASKYKELYGYCRISENMPLDDTVYLSLEQMTINGAAEEEWVDQYTPGYNVITEDFDAKHGYILLPDDQPITINGYIGTKKYEAVLKPAMALLRDDDEPVKPDYQLTNDGYSILDMSPLLEQFGDAEEIYGYDSADRINFIGTDVFLYIEY